MNEVQQQTLDGRIAELRGLIIRYQRLWAAKKILNFPVKLVEKLEQELQQAILEREQR